MRRQVHFVVLLLSSTLCAAELPHLSVDEYRRQGGGHKPNLNKEGGVSGGSRHGVSSNGLKTSASLMMLSNLELEPGMEQTMKQPRCVDPYRSIPLYGWRWFQKFGNDLQAALQCWGLSEMQAKMRDSSFEARRTHCARRALSSQGFMSSHHEVNAAHLDEMLCHALTEAIRSKDPRIQFARRVKLCMREKMQKLQMNSTTSLEDILIECMQKHKSVSMKPSIRDEELDSEFGFGHEMYVQAVRTADGLLSEMNHCLRYYGLVAKEAEEYKHLEKSCRSQSHNDSMNRHADNEYQIDVCIFSNSTKGRVAREDISVQYSCLNQLLSSTSSTEESKKILLDLFWNQTQPLHMDDQITCKALSGRPRWIKTPTGWKLTCERLRTLKAKRQAEIEDLPEEATTQAEIPSQLGEDRSRGSPGESTTEFYEDEGRMQPTDGPMPTDSPSTPDSTDRFQVLEQLNQCILAKLRTSSARAALAQMEKVHREWLQKHATCWNKFKGDEGRFSAKTKQPYRVGTVSGTPVRG